MAPGRTFSREFKLAVVREIASGAKRLARACREYAFCEGVVLRWRHEYEARGEDVFSPREVNEVQALEQRIAELERVCGPLAVENGVKKGAQRTSVAERHAMIDLMHDAVPALSLRRLCELTGTGRTWYYTHPSAADVAARDTTLRDAIEHLVLEFPGYGYRRVTKALQRDGWEINHKWMLRVMRQESLLCQLQRHFVVTTQSDHDLVTYPNPLADAHLTRRDQACVADITYIHLPSAFAYLACVLDAWSRQRLGWQLSQRIDTSLSLAALDRALHARHPAPGVIHHSDRGVQYASAAYSSTGSPTSGRGSACRRSAIRTTTPGPRASSRRSNGRRST